EKRITNSIGMQLVLVPPGRFLMGAAQPLPAEGALREVRITKPFYMGAFEVTQGQYRKVVGHNPSFFTSAGSVDQPVEQVSWENAIEFCRLLSAMDAERKAGRVYRLPTEAEWEYACRAGAKTVYSFGDDPKDLGRHAWYESNSGGTTHPVG